MFVAKILNFISNFGIEKMWNFSNLQISWSLLDLIRAHLVNKIPQIVTQGRLALIIFPFIPSILNEKPVIK